MAQCPDCEDGKRMRMACYGDGPVEVREDCETCNGEGTIPDAEPQFDDYQIAGSMGDYGGGNVDWWHTYIRNEVERANAHWRDQVEDSAKDGEL